MQRDAILNRVRQVVGLPLLATTVGCSSYSSVGAALKRQVGPTVAKAPAVSVASLMGQDGSPVTDYLTEEERLYTVEDCLELLPTCPTACDLGSIVHINDADIIAEYDVVVSNTRFQPAGSPPTCDDPLWTFERSYYRAPTPGVHGKFPPHGSILYHSVGYAATGEVTSAGRLGTMSVIPGRPFNGHTAPSSTPSTNHWLVAAQHEHASVASFARHLLEMMSLGAPVTLLQAITRAQQDEVRHTQLCLQRAAQDGVEASLGPLDIHVPIRTTPYEVARGVALEGCINETLAVLAMSSDIALASPDDAALLASIITDETRHAELAWTSLVWLWPQLTSDDQRRLQQDMNHAIPTRYRRALRPIVHALAA